MKQRFITGLIILLPLIVTWYILYFVIQLTTEPFQIFIKALLHALGIQSDHQIISIVSTALILISIVVVTCLVGMLGEWFFVKSCIRLFDKTLLAMPVVRKIYKTCKDLTEIFFSTDKPHLSKVVWVPFPDKNQKILGFITMEVPLPCDGNTPYVAVLVPGTPNPTVGFLLFIPKEKVEMINIPVDQAIKWIISCGTTQNLVSTPE